MAAVPKNSFDLLRLMAATLVLYGHQHVLTGLVEPQFFGWNTLGGVGVSIFFFLSGLLVWSSWVRDPHWMRFFVKRSLRIFPGLWLVVFATVLLFGPALSSLGRVEYFSNPGTWDYLSTAALYVQFGLPGVFDNNPYPHIVNGSLWTLPAEFLCYVSVAVFGSLSLVRQHWVWGGGLLLAILLAELGPAFLGARFTAHFEMAAFFWWGIWYGYVSRSFSSNAQGLLILSAVALLIMLVFGPRGVERTAMLVCVATLVMLAQHQSLGSRLTDQLGDISYGMYIFAFPVQQWVSELSQGRHSSFWLSLSLSFALTAGLAYASWHLIEKRALFYKPQSREAS